MPSMSINQQAVVLLYAVPAVLKVKMPSQEEANGKRGICMECNSLRFLYAGRAIDELSGKECGGEEEKRSKARAYACEALRWCLASACLVVHINTHT
jgi:hypothetical protein